LVSIEHEKPIVKPLERVASSKSDLDAFPGPARREAGYALYLAQTGTRAISMAKESEIQVERSSGNVFADLRIPNPEEYLAKAKLATRIIKIIRRRRLTQTAAGKLLGISQPKVSALLHGGLDGFSTDRLFRFLNALGCDVQITISKPRPRSRGKVQVKAG
jgi:predicted XRE-type DNA-binding protein